MAKFGIGQAVRRVEDQRFLTGAGRYVDDIALPGMCHGVVLLSPHAHARIKKVDVSKAKAAPGVLLVLTGADVAADISARSRPAMMPEDIGAPKGHRIHQQLLTADKARFVGDRVAFVVAETQAQARDAAELIEVDYETLPAVALVEDAAKDGAPKVWDDNPNGNVAFMLMFGDQAATDAAFAKAKHVVKLRMENNRLTAGVDGAAHRDRRLQRRGRRLHALYLVAESAWRAHGDRAHLPCQREPGARGRARRRRRLRPEGRRVPGRRAGDVGLEEAAPPGEMGRDALGKHDDRPHRPRSRQLRRARARREGQDPRASARSRCSRSAPISSAPAW